MIHRPTVSSGHYIVTIHKDPHAAGQGRKGIRVHEGIPAAGHCPDSAQPRRFRPLYGLGGSPQLSPAVQHPRSARYLAMETNLMFEDSLMAKLWHKAMHIPEQQTSRQEVHEAMLRAGLCCCIRKYCIMLVSENVHLQLSALSLPSSLLLSSAAALSCQASATMLSIMSNALSGALNSIEHSLTMPCWDRPLILDRSCFNSSILSSPGLANFRRAKSLGCFLSDVAKSASPSSARSVEFMTCSTSFP